MTEKNQKPTKYGFADILKKAMLGCAGECGDGCSCCSGDIRAEPKNDAEKEEKD